MSGRKLSIGIAGAAALLIVVVLAVPLVRAMVLVQLPEAGTGTGHHDPVIAAAGDIACASWTVAASECHQEATSNLLWNGGFDAVLDLGDNQYESGTLAAYDNYYDSTWGRVKPITHPVPGNHEYETANATGYYSYFGSAAGDPSKGYYSYDLESWHIVALNSNCANVGGCGAGSPEGRWLRSDLAAHPATCTLAYWHHPRFSSGTTHGSDTTYTAFWQALYEAGADVVLVGHEHNYERFAQQRPDGSLDRAKGIREFVVGTGGREHYPFGAPIANSQVRNNTTFGVLKMVLHPGSYEWQFMPQAGESFADSGTTACH